MTLTCAFLHRLGHFHCCASCHEDYEMGYDFLYRTLRNGKEVQCCCRGAHFLDESRPDLLAEGEYPSLGVGPAVAVSARPLSLGLTTAPPLRPGDSLSYLVG